jgi:hypothetical protein
LVMKEKDYKSSEKGLNLTLVERETGFEPATSYLEDTPGKNWEALTERPLLL